MHDLYGTTNRLPPDHAFVEPGFGCYMSYLEEPFRTQLSAYDCGKPVAFMPTGLELEILKLAIATSMCFKSDLPSQAHLGYPLHTPSPKHFLTLSTGCANQCWKRARSTLTRDFLERSAPSRDFGILIPYHTAI